MLAPVSGSAGRVDCYDGDWRAVKNYCVCLSMTFAAAAAAAAAHDANSCYKGRGVSSDGLLGDGYTSISCVGITLSLSIVSPFSPSPVPPLPSLLLTMLLTT